MTVALCTYNGQRFLQDQLDSLVAQTHRPDEVVIGDDHSTDATLDLIEAFGRKAPFPVHVLQREANVGTSANFSETLRRSSGDVIFLSDQDDRWVPHKVERMLDVFAKRRQLLALHTDARLVDADGAPLGTTLFHALRIGRGELSRVRAGDAFDALIRRNLATGATMAIRRELLDVALPVPADWVHDEWLAMIAACLGRGRVDVLPDALIDYRQHGGNQIGARRMTLGENIGRVFVDRTAFYDWQRRRVEGLEEKLRSLRPPVADRLFAMLDEKRVHIDFRAALPRNRLLRLLPMLGELATGRYGRYSTGVRSVARDFFGRA